MRETRREMIFSQTDREEIFLDNNATTPPLPEVQEAVLAALTSGFGNPSSAHGWGWRARRTLDAARESVARLAGVDPDRIVFTSGGTEANNAVLHSAAFGSRTRPRIITSVAEHSSVLRYCDYLENQGCNVVRVGVDESGIVRIGELAATLTSETALCSIHWVNNETGVVQPVNEIAALCHERGIAFHTDAAQALGKLEATLDGPHLDYITFTAHKIHGPQGAGAIVVRKPRSMCPLLWGGDQESSVRAGTENLPGIAGFGAAARIRARDRAEIIPRLRSMRDLLEGELSRRLLNVQVNALEAPRVCNTTNLLFGGLDGEALVAHLDQCGVLCSQSSACTSQRPEPSYVLRAMGLSESEAYASIRFAVSQLNTQDEIRSCADTIVQLCHDLDGSPVWQTLSPENVVSEGGR